ncbi:MAG: GNAT family N-acetyltransferase [Alphaproteobacteria bacterium]|nr:GNAT family N-acetyltransferase [Alphaproteobacteria bacterium]
MSTVTVRRATREDAETIHRFSVALATFEGEPDAVKATPAVLARDGFGPSAKFATLIAELDGRPVGFALYTFNYSVWEARRGIFLEDIWVEPEVREAGVGRALMAALARECRDEGYGRIDLNVLHWNPARRFYEAVGCAHIESWLPYRIRGQALQALANS